MIFKKAFKFFLFLGLTWILGFAWYIATTLTMKPHAPGKPTEAIVVLTGGKQRIEKGLELLARNQAGYLFISGVFQDVTEDEIRRMWKSEPRLPACCIILGRLAHTTVQNGEETRDWLRKKKFTSIRLVTANYHMHRGVLELSSAMPDLEIIKHPVIQSDLRTDTLRFWTLMISEYNKIIVRWFSIKVLSPLQNLND